MSGQGVRFAPSPTGAFHLGNFRTAWISHAIARRLGEPWVVRFEDIDQPRVVEGALDRQLEEMARLGLVPAQVLVQSSQLQRHWEVFRLGVASHQVYPCYCSRKDVREALEGIASAPHAEAPIYNGHCRDLARGPSQHGLPSLAWRFRAKDSSGGQDFVVARSGLLSGAKLMPDTEGFVPAYHWACAIDDYDGGYSWLVRAWDLASAANPQRWIGEWLAKAEGRAFAAPKVFHCALVTQEDGARLEKRTRGVTLPELEAAGWGPSRLTAAFAAGFDGASFPGEGERKQALRVSEVLR